VHGGRRVHSTLDFPDIAEGDDLCLRRLDGRKHLFIWAILAGALWAVANTLTVFAIRDVGLATAFPLWNTNCLVGLGWGMLLFRELEGASAKNLFKVILGAVVIVIAAIMLGFSTIQSGSANSPHAVQGLLAAGAASLMWGTMYIPYRKAYLSGMNPLSFVTVFTVGELGTMFLLTFTLDGGLHSSAFQLAHNKQLLFWLFLAASFGWSAICSSSSPPSTWASAAAFRFQIPTNCGDSHGARWCLANSLLPTALISSWW